MRVLHPVLTLEPWFNGRSRALFESESESETGPACTPSVGTVAARPDSTAPETEARNGWF